MFFKRRDNQESTPPRIIGAVSLGEAQRQTSFLIATASGAPAIGLPPLFECIYIRRYKTSTPMASIAVDVDRLRRIPALGRHLDWAFDGVKPDLVIDATLVGDSTFADFSRLYQSRALSLHEFVALKVSPHADRALGPDLLYGASWYRLPRAELASAMRAALDSDSFEIRRSVERGLRKATLREFRLFQGKTGTHSRSTEEATPDDDILYAAMSAVWHGSQAIPAPPVFLPIPEPVEPSQSWPPPLDMSRHFCYGAPTCGQCGFRYPEEFWMIWTCPKCKAHRGFTKAPARTEFSAI
jgi:hypothetical protein